MEQEKDNLERLKIINKKLVQRLINAVGEIKTEVSTAKFEDRDNSDYHVEVYVLPTANEVKEFSDLPKEFEAPAAVIHDWKLMERIRKTTPYGDLPDFILGSDNKVYGFDNTYYLNLAGEAQKYEETIYFSHEGESLTETLNQWGLKEEELIKVDFVPDQKDNRFVNLEPGDYEKIATLLHQIESGELVRKIDT